MNRALLHKNTEFVKIRRRKFKTESTNELSQEKVY